jgi:RecA-family ATPase
MLTDLARDYPLWTPPGEFMFVQDMLAIENDHREPIIENGIMPNESHLLIAGESGVGKSLLRLELAIHMAIGWEWLGFKIPKPRRVLVMQWENPEITERNRLVAMCEGLDIPPASIKNLQFLPRKVQYKPPASGTFNSFPAKCNTT